MQKEEQELISFLTLLRQYDAVIRQQINNETLDWNELAEVKRTLLTRLDSPSVEEVVNYLLVNSSREKIIQLTRNFDAVYNALTELGNARSFEIEANSSTESFRREHELFELDVKAYTGKFTEVRKKKEALERSLDSYFYGGDDASRIKAELEIDQIEPIFQSKLRDYEAKILESKQFFDSNFQLTKSILEEVINALTVRIKSLFDIYRENSQRGEFHEYFPMSLVGAVYETLKENKIIEADAHAFYAVINLNKDTNLKISPKFILYYLIDSFSRSLDDSAKNKWVEEIHIMQNIKQSSYIAHYRDIQDSRKWKKLYECLEGLFNQPNKE
ncbi:hypothetical protein [Albibacterium sp.]|uniref:hypothetical protein n=1 Tax=Albibacterium sp. TaxID=2952885 RepID=UPI002B70F27D|nr:hypothetical protein [Albibacterium sp.]HUH18557.1 hypothetical protein [Albibacterium sp.]